MSLNRSNLHLFKQYLRKLQVGVRARSRVSCISANYTNPKPRANQLTPKWYPCTQPPRWCQSYKRVNELSWEASTRALTHLKHLSAPINKRKRSRHHAAKDSCILSRSNQLISLIFRANGFAIPGSCVRDRNDFGARVSAAIVVLCLCPCTTQDIEAPTRCAHMRYCNTPDCITMASNKEGTAISKRGITRHWAKTTRGHALFLFIWD